MITDLTGQKKKTHTHRRRKLKKRERFGWKDKATVKKKRNNTRQYEKRETDRNRATTNISIYSK